MIYIMNQYILHDMNIMIEHITDTYVSLHHAFDILNGRKQDHIHNVYLYVYMYIYDTIAHNIIIMV